METVTISEMLEAMNTGLPFSVSFVSYDKQRKKGGEIKYYKEVVLNADVKDKKFLEQTQRANSLLSKERGGVSKNPHHYENSTRTFRVCVNGCKTSTVKKLHIFLVLEFNGKKLIL